MNRCKTRLSAVGFWLLGLLLASSLQAATTTDNFALGNERYAAGDYSGAAKAYEAQVHNGSYSANLFYNLGDAYYRQNDRGRAILNYRRALLLEPSHAEAVANLAFVNAGKGTTGRGEATGVWQAAPWAAAVCGWLGAAGLLTALASRRYRPAGVAITVGGLLLCAVGVGAIYRFGDTETAARAVVVAEAAPALYSPVDNAKVVTTLPAGAEVRVLSEQGAWWYVLLADGTTRAWLAANQAEPLIPK